MTTAPVALAEWLGYATPPLWLELVLDALVAGVIVTILLLTSAVAGPWAKRKITAMFTDRIAVDRIGPFGVLTIVSDAVRLMSKELIIPDGADRPAFDIAPAILPLSALLGFAVIPMGSGLQLADPEIGLVYVFAVSGIASVGMVVGGYASGSKYSLLGSMRSVAESIAYEIPLVVTAASIVLLTGTLQLSEIVAAQQGTLFALGPIAVPAWYGFLNPFALALFLVASLAEVGRNPFDIGEAATEIVGGYITEYSSIYFVLFFLGEFLHIFLSGAVITTLFLGGPAGPGPAWLGIVWFVVKIWAVFLFTQWCRSAVPRVRIDQMLEIGWKGLLVLSFANLVLTAIIVGVIA
ncbi:NADH-quinone oxidoreductase subunit H [Halarchaeum sp. CBA1220]|uniref:NADH dehydrogenase n=1 Tax=Halarchaeum grantii TaxID=1193105 RepID=A0A830F1C3_9EURY|nr:MULTISPECIES: complex I subunit 1 family protein [Halarchaeum]QLC33956.1 NADH-quinone oxidoreductase subunit H [Halarchaeum sp. CBA1220]GGL30806.1 NADH dehydrogenase [Halarchaeum grantii]